MYLKKGIKLIEERPGEGEPVKRHRHYRLSIRLSLNRGELINTPAQCLSHSTDMNNIVHADGFYEYTIRVDRERLIDGLFYTVQGMNVGGYRKVAISPHLAYKEKGIPGVIPENAKLVAEIYILSEEKH